MLSAPAPSNGRKRSSRRLVSNMPLSLLAAAGDDRLHRARVVDEAVVLGALPRVFAVLGDRRTCAGCCLSSDSVQLTLVYGPTTDGIERATLLMRRM